MLRTALITLLASAMLAGVAAAQKITREEFEQQVDAHRKDVKAMSREADPMKWAKAQADFGLELSYSTGPESVKESIDAFKSALEVYSFATTPVEWARTQEMLGVVYYKTALWKNVAVAMSRGLVGPPDTSADFQNALQAFEAAKQVRTPTAFPREWARLQILVADIHVNLALSIPDDRVEKQKHRDVATVAYNAVLQEMDENADPFERGWAHESLALMNEHGYVNETDRMQFALEHAKLAKADFIAAGESERAERLDQTISSLEYDLKHAENHVPDANDDLFGAKYH